METRDPTAYNVLVREHESEPMAMEIGMPFLWEDFPLHSHDIHPLWEFL